MTTTALARLACLALLLAGCASGPRSTDGAPSSPRMFPFLMFQDGRAEEALEFYAATFPDGRVLELEHFGPGEAGVEGTLKLGEVEVAGQRLLATDSPPIHEFGFTPSVSLFVNCASAAEVDALAARLSEGGAVMMPAGSYPFSPRFAWVADAWGVSWQLYLPPDPDSDG